MAAGYLASTYDKQWEPTHNLILGAMVAVAVYWVLTLKVIRELVLWGMALAILYQLYQPGFTIESMTKMRCRKWLFQWR